MELKMHTARNENSFGPGCVVVRTDAALEAGIGKRPGEMTLAQKIGRLIQAGIGSVTPDDLLHYPLGSILTGGSCAPCNNEFAPPSKWLTVADRFYESSTDPSHGPHAIATMGGTDRAVVQSSRAAHT